MKFNNKNKIFNLKNNKGSRFINLYSNCIKRHIRSRCAPVDGNPEYSKGFTLVETLVAVFILTISLAALLNLVSTSLTSFKYSRDDVTANYLIQEVVDSVRNKRDSMAFLGNDWDSFINHYQSCYSSGCTIDVLKEMYQSGSSVNSCNGSCPYLYLDGSAGGAGYYSPNSQSGNESIFKRTVTMDKVDNTLNVNVNVSWEAGSSTRTRSLQFSLLKWR